MRNFLKIICCFLMILFLRFLMSFMINEYIIYNYNKGIYNDKLIKLLYIFNINQPYIAYYNEGNILYQLNDYDNAIKHYDTSLQKNPPKSRVCDIRINLSLALIRNIDSDDSTTIYNQLEAAKENLYKDNCADPFSNNGESSDAEDLEDKITELEKQFESSSNSPGETPNPNIEEELKNIESTARSSRENELSNYENLGQYSYYSGKSW